MTKLLNIPEFLNGEVQTFENLIQDLFEKRWIHDTPLSEFYSEYKILAAFFNETFTIKMIEKYFLGWEQEDYRLFCLNDYQIRFTDDSMYVATGGGDWDFPVPKTLSQFISNCNQCDINLIWNK